MIIDFKNMQETELPNFYGGEKSFIAKIFNDGKNKILYGRLESGASIGVHTHETSSEIIYILKGSGKMLFDGEYEALSEGMCHYCPKGHTHSLINSSDGDLVFFAVVPEQ